MVTIAIKDNHEPNVIKLTYENLFKELKDVLDADIIVVDDWFDAIPKVKKNLYVCFVEADCLVNSGYFTSQLGLFKKNPYFRKLAMLSSATGVNNWGNKFYGYSIAGNYSDGVIPNKEMKSNQVYPVQIGYVPGALIRVNMLQNALNSLKPSGGFQDDLVRFSAALSFAFWKQGDGNRVHINPNTTYVTTEDYVNDIGYFDPEPGDLIGKFGKEGIT